MSEPTSAGQSSLSNASARQSSLSNATGRAAPVDPNIPSILQTPVEMIDYTFQLRDCKLMVFHEVLDKNSSTVYDLMYAVAKKHGDTVEPDKVQIFTKENEDDDYHPISDISEKLSNLGDVDTFYYDFNPVSGSLLIIPNEK